jgi:hypothetical protein
MRWREIRFDKLIGWLLPTFLRKVKQFAWLYALLYPVVWLYENVLYRMQHDCRVKYMEKMLNEWFNTPDYNPNDHEDTKTVFIGDGFRPKKTYIFQDYENKPVYAFQDTEEKPIYIYRALEFLQNYYNFIVWVPLSYVYNEAILKARINYYKLAGKKYKIEHY